MPNISPQTVEYFHGRKPYILRVERVITDRQLEESAETSLRIDGTKRFIARKRLYRDIGALPVRQALKWMPGVITPERLSEAAGMLRDRMNRNSRLWAVYCLSRLAPAGLEPAISGLVQTRPLRRLLTRSGCVLETVHIMPNLLKADVLAAGVYTALNDYDALAIVSADIPSVPLEEALPAMLQTEETGLHIRRYDALSVTRLQAGFLREYPWLAESKRLA